VADIQKTWHFQCSCARCNDPTEFGTMMSGLICSSECPGILLPIRSNLIGSPWSCNTCNRKLGILAVQKVMKQILDQIAENRHSSNENLLELIEKLSGKVVHKNHYLLIGIKEILLQRLMWSINKQTIYTNLTTEDKIKFLTLRTQLFREVVDILAVVDSPGAPWKQKLEKMETEEFEKLGEIRADADTEIHADADTEILAHIDTEIRAHIDTEIRAHVDTEIGADSDK